MVQCEGCKESAEADQSPNERERCENMTTCEYCDKSLCEECVEATEVVNCDACGHCWWG